MVRIRLVMPDRSVRYLVVELFGRHANILVLDGDDMILELHHPFRGRQRTLEREGLYEPLVAPHASTRKRKRRFEAEEDSPLREAPLNGSADAFYIALENRRALDRHRQWLKRAVARTLKREGGLLSRLREDLTRSESAEQVRREAELLQSHFHLLRRGMDAVEVSDLYADGEARLTLILDPTLDPAANVEAYFKRYKKLVAARGPILERIEAVQVRLRVLRDIERELPRFETEEAIEEAAGRAGLKKPPSKRPVKKRDPPGSRMPTRYRRYRSSDGLAIIVGKGGDSNDRLTFRVARGNDYWLHCQGAAGSHVIVRALKNKTVPLNTLIEAGARRGAFLEAPRRRSNGCHVHPAKIRAQGKGRRTGSGLSRALQDPGYPIGSGPAEKGAGLGARKCRIRPSPVTLGPNAPYKSHPAGCGHQRTVVRGPWPRYGSTKGDSVERSDMSYEFTVQKSAFSRAAVWLGLAVSLFGSGCFGLHGKRTNRARRLQAQQ